MSELWEARRELHDDPPLLTALDELQREPVKKLKQCACGCGRFLSSDQVARRASCASAACRSRLHEIRDPRISNASVEQLEGELLKRLGKAAGRAEDRMVTVRALTRNVRVLKLTWMKVRSMTPSRETFMQTLEKLVHEAWISREAP